MSKRLKVLLSAYACEPNKGSEPEVGWQWALQMARFHDVTVLTRANNRQNIENELERLRGKLPLPNFVYHEEEPLLLSLKSRFKAVHSYYMLWQKSAHEVVATLHRERGFDLLHHVTFAGYRYPTAIWGHGVPCIWGPVGGIESIPLPLLPWTHPKSLLYESLRNIHNSLESLPFHALPKRAQQSTCVLASTREMQRSLEQLGTKAELVPTIGLHFDETEITRREPNRGPLRLLFVGNIITLKGVNLALHALSRSGSNATFTLVGDGDFLPAAKKLVKKLGLSAQVEFRGRLPRAEVLKIYSNFDLFLFPSLHDTGGYAVIEAMSNGLPVICMDCGGPAVAVQENCGKKIPIGSRRSVIGGLAQALKNYDQDRELLSEHGKAARAAVLQNYDWKKKGEQMNEIYHQTVSDSKSSKPSVGYFLAAWKLFSLKQLFLSTIILLSVGILGSLSLSQLKKKAELIVANTLPSISFAGEATANLGQAFNRTLQLFMTEDPATSARLELEIEALSGKTTIALNGYANSLDSDFDRKNFLKLLDRREKYLQIRTQIIALAQNGRRNEAISRCETTLLPAYNEYKRAGDVLLDYNLIEGKKRGQTIMTVCTVTQFFVAGFVILTFVIGFIFGLFR